MNDKLRRNTLPPGYVYDSREGRQVPGDQILPTISKTRTEQLMFMDGVTWLMEHLITYKADTPEILPAAWTEVKKRYPDYD